MADANIYDIGDEVKCQGTFTDPENSDAAIDPTNVFFSVIDPSGNQTDYTYGVDAQLVKSSTGVYYVNVDADEAGTWWFRFYSTGTGKAAEEQRFIVDTSRFV